jgi:flagellum-specific peptidoglycan hydrolase FlgJ
MREKKKFAGLSAQFSPTDYLGWVKGIERAGYASSRKWGKQVLALINKYDLHSFDSKADSTEFAQTPQQNQQ